MMWRVIRCLGAGLLTVASAWAAQFELVGVLPERPSPVTVTVLRESLEQRSTAAVASATVEGGRAFTLTVDAEPGLFKLKLGPVEIPFVAGDQQTLRVTSHQEGAVEISGAPDQQLFRAYETFRATSLGRTVTPVRAALREARASADHAAIDRLTEAEIAGYDAHRRELVDFTLAELSGSPALYAASLRWDGDYRLDELAAVVAEFAAKHPRLEISRLMSERMARFRATALGAVAPPLSGPAPNGDPVRLTDLRGRYVLVDFWASWCPPCRIENRHYVGLYQKYRDAGFEILAVSVDQNGAAWRNAIAQDGAVWLHLSDLTGWKTPLAATYNITALPASFLLDPDGRIIGKNLRGPALEAMLAQRLARP